MARAAGRTAVAGLALVLPLAAAACEGSVGLSEPGSPPASGSAPSSGSPPASGPAASPGDEASSLIEESFSM